MISNLLLGMVSLILAAAALQDCASLRISNIWPVLVAAGYGLWVAHAGPEADMWMNIVDFVAILLFGTILFMFRWLGGGDVKLWAASALWFDFHSMGAFMLYTVAAGGVLALALIAMRRLVPLSEDGIAILRPKGPIPYGVAVAIGAIAALHLAGPNPEDIAARIVGG